MSRYCSAVTTATGRRCPDFRILGFDLMMETGIGLSLKLFAPEELTERTLFMHNLRRDGIEL